MTKYRNAPASYQQLRPHRQQDDIAVIHHLLSTAGNGIPASFVSSTMHQE
ncbi:hypothetical protein [Zobellella maritima]|nr:hypothetical protein [Zobellella maritima]